MEYIDAIWKKFEAQYKRHLPHDEDLSFLRNIFFEGSCAVFSTLYDDEHMPVIGHDSHADIIKKVHQAQAVYNQVRTELNNFRELQGLTADQDLVN